MGTSGILSGVSSGLVIAILSLLVAGGLFVASLLVLATVGFFWMRSGDAEAPPPPDEGERQRQVAAARGRVNSAPPPPPPARPSSAPPPPPGRPASRPPPAAAAPQQPPPMLGFFDDETSTGASFGQARQSLGSPLLSVPPGGLVPPEPKRPQLGANLDDDDEGEGATEIFSAGQVSAEFAALLEEPEESTPSPGNRRK